MKQRKQANNFPLSPIEVEVESIVAGDYYE